MKEPSLEEVIKRELESYNGVCHYAGHSEMAIHNTEKLANDIAKKVRLNYKSDYIPASTSW